MAVRIVIVDDETSFAEIGHLILSRAGYEVLIFDRAKEVIHQLEKMAPDLILSDVEMPEMDGFDFLRAVREHKTTKDLPFILMSARRTYPPDRVKGLDLGSDDYITKPFSGDELVSRVNAVLRRSGKQIASAPPPTEVSTEKAALPAESSELESYLKKNIDDAAATAAPPPAANPFHGVLDPLPIFEDLRRRLAEKKPTIVILADLSFFRGYNECYGFAQGDNVLRFSRQCLDAANHLAGAKDVVSHLYADEFMILTEPDRAPAIARNALSAFLKGVTGLYAEEDRARGFVEGKTRMGRTVAYPFLNLILAVASNQNRTITHPGHFIHILRELQSYAKTLGGSRYVEDRRRDPPPKP